MKRIKAKTILWLMVFSGFAVNYMVRSNLNIVLIVMVQPKQSVNTTSTESVCGNTNILNATESRNEQQEPVTSKLVGDAQFDWNEYEQNAVLGAYFWLHWLTQVPGGVLARRFGTKLVFGLGNGIPILLTFLIPWAASMNYRALAVLRLLQGFISGLVWPSMHNMTALWVPPNERSSFITAYLGSSVGAAFAFFFCGHVTHYFGWETALYATAIIGLVWLVGWIFLVYDSPAKHPRISQKEKAFIEDALQGTVTTDKIATPWLNILTSVPVWMIIVAQWAGIWGLFTLMTQTPTYFRNVHGWDVRTIGLASGIPHIARITFAAVFGAFCDRLLKKNSMSRTNVRKLATAVGIIGQGILAAGAALAGCGAWTATACIIGASAVHGAISSGPLAAMVDISPNFASIVLGISGLVTVIPGVLSPVVVGAITYQNQTVSAWGKVFWIMAAQLIVCGLLYVAFGTTDLQPWNSPGQSVPKEEKGEVTKGKEDIADDDDDDYDEEKEEQALQMINFS